MEVSKGGNGKSDGLRFLEEVYRYSGEKRSVERAPEEHSRAPGAGAV